MIRAKSKSRVLKLEPGDRVETCTSKGRPSRQGVVLCVVGKAYWVRLEDDSIEKWQKLEYIPGADYEARKAAIRAGWDKRTERLRRAIVDPRVETWLWAGVEE